MNRDFAHLPPDPSWSFGWCTARQTGYITHCYHRYPAKFIPQLAARLIEEYSEPDDVVLDPFMGSGTALVEALVAGRRAWGIDINPAAVIASRAKTTPISPIKLRAALLEFEDRISWLQDEHLGRTFFPLPEPLLPGDQERLDWWFPKGQQPRLGIVLATIEAVALALKDSGYNYGKMALYVVGAGMALAILFATGGGYHWLWIVDHFFNEIGLIMIGILECFIVAWVYDTKAFVDAVNETSELSISKWWVYSIKYVTPAALTIVLVGKIISTAINGFEGYPAWALLAGGFIPVCLIIYLSYYLSRRLRERH